MARIRDATIKLLVLLSPLTAKNPITEKFFEASVDICDNSVDPVFNFQNLYVGLTVCDFGFVFYTFVQ